MAHDPRGTGAGATALASIPTSRSAVGHTTKSSGRPFTIPLLRVGSWCVNVCDGKCTRVTLASHAVSRVCVHAYEVFFLYELPSDKRASPPVGVHRMVEQFLHMTGDWAWEKTVVMAKQSRHRTSMKYELGDCTNL